MSIKKFTPFLCFDGHAEEAANFYVSVFKNSKITHVSHFPEGTPAPVGSVMTVNFVLDGHAFMALNGGPSTTFNEAISLMVHCDTQEELDGYWDKLSDGGEVMACGWLKDKYGLAWQIVPSQLDEWMTCDDVDKTNRVMHALWQMIKIDIETLRRAADKIIITIQSKVNAPINKVWQHWTKPEHIVHWNNASDDWCTPRAENDLREGGSFNYRMESTDGKMGFDFNGEYTLVHENECIKYTLGDERTVEVHFLEEADGVVVKEVFEAEDIHSAELQRAGWQAILDNFKNYVEQH